MPILDDDEATTDPTEVVPEVVQEEVHEENQVLAPLNQPDLIWLNDHPPNLVIESIEAGVRTRRQLDTMLACFLSQIEPKVAEDALTDADWIIAMQEELNEFERNQVWELVPRPKHQNVVGTKWVFRNKMDENCIIVRNKARLVAQDYLIGVFLYTFSIINFMLIIIRLYLNYIILAHICYMTHFPIDC
ncbi:hypothetical protein Dimus_038546 [Dionaea muscipula]